MTSWSGRRLDRWWPDGVHVWGVWGITFGDFSSPGGESVAAAGQLPCRLVAVFYIRGRPSTAIGCGTGP
jgi:hypothetical protein